MPGTHSSEKEEKIHKTPLRGLSNREVNKNKKEKDEHDMALRGSVLRRHTNISKNHAVKATSPTGCCRCIYIKKEWGTRGGDNLREMGNV